MRHLTAFVVPMILCAPFAACGSSDATATVNADSGATTDVGSGIDAAERSDAGTTEGEGHVLFATGEGDSTAFYRIAASEGASPENLDAVFDSLSAGQDQKMNLSGDGQWAVVDSTRFGCDGYACVARIRTDGSEGDKVLAEDTELHVYATPPAISNDGNLIVLTQFFDSASKVELVATRFESGAWSAISRITRESPYAFNRFASISPDGSHVIFGCSNDADESSGNSICEVSTNGTEQRVILAVGDLPGTGRNLHHPVYAPDGSIVFEGESDAGEQVWRIVPGSAPTVIHDDYSNDNTPCVLPDGRIASLWLGRDGNDPSYHELKLMDSDGMGELMLVIGQDLSDIGLGCSQ